MRYKFYAADKKVICISSYAGKTVKGIAKCDPKDTFNLEDGKKLAIARCAHKIAKKRMMRAEAKLAEATKALAAAREYMDKMQKYYDDSSAEFVKISEGLKELEASM